METKVTNSAERRFILLVALQCLTLVVAVLALWSNHRGGTPKDRAELVRTTAAKLQAAGLSSEAIFHYEEYARDPSLDPRTRANVSFILGQLYEAEGRPERALAWYYQVEGSDPSSPEQKDAAKRIVALLEALGRHQAAKSVLSNATSLEGGKSDESKVVAQIGDKKITMAQLDSTLDNIPPQIKVSFAGADGKKTFLKKYVADELLYEKAKRLGYDLEPKWIKQLEELKRQALVARILNEDVLAKVSVDEKDLKNYFEANKGKYASKDKKGKKLPKFDEIKQAVEQDYRLEKSQTKYQELIEQLVAGDSIKLFPENVK